MTTPEVYFYTTNDDRPGAAAHLACRIIEKAYRQGLRIYVHAGSPRQLRFFDELLWTFREGSFVPHERAGQTRPDGGLAAPVRIGCGPVEAGEATLLCNLSDEVPTALDDFERVIEVSDVAEPGHTRARQRFRWYRQQGYVMQHHAMNSND